MTKIEWENPEFVSFIQRFISWVELLWVKQSVFQRVPLESDGYISLWLGRKLWETLLKTLLMIPNDFCVNH